MQGTSPYGIINEIFPTGHESRDGNRSGSVIVNNRLRINIVAGDILSSAIVPGKGPVMKRIVVAAIAVYLAFGCSSTTTKSIKVFVDPPDAVISVISGPRLQELKYHSPAAITIELPKDPALASKAVLEVRKDAYITRTIALRDITDGQTLNIKLEKDVQRDFHYRLSYRLVAPAASDALRYRDDSITVSFMVSDQSFQMRLENLTSGNIKILWERSQYTNVSMQSYQLMHSGVRFQERNNPIPDQIVRPHVSIQEAVFPITNVFFVPQKKTYDIHPLFSLYSDAAADLKGKTFSIFIPIEIDRAITPYIFKIEIIDAVKESIKK
jgi:hypothetical protein